MLVEKAFERSGYKSSEKLRKIRCAVLKKYIELSFNAAIHGYQVRLSKKISLIPVILMSLDSSREGLIPKNKQSSRFPELGFDIIIQHLYSMARFRTRIYKKWFNEFRKIYESDLVYELIRKKL